MIMHKLTREGLAAEVARTDFALPEADWNEQQPTPADETLAQLHDRLRAHFQAEGITFEYTWSGGGRVYVVDGEYFTPRGAEAHFLAPPVRTGKPTWGPRHVVEYRPRWKTDHHPWLVAGMDPKTGIRYADYEVAEGV
jgi:hypothetical protein